MMEFASVTVDIPVADIVVGKRLRPVTKPGVERMVGWLSEGGQRTPISVRMVGTPTVAILIAGAHRLEAAKKLGWPSIRAVVEEMDELEAKLWEIAENLHRNELTALERDEQVSLWIELSQQRHKPRQVDEVYKGGRGKTGGTAEASRDLGISEPDARRAAKVAALPDEAKKIAREAGLDDNRAALLDAANRETPEEQIESLRTRAEIKETSLDKPDERDALDGLGPDKRRSLIDRAKAGEKVSAKTELKKDKRDSREAELGARQRSLPDKKYGVIYCDYARRFNVRSRETGLDRSPDNHYPTMTFNEIVDLPVASIAADDCVLFMWSTGASLLDDLEIMAEWGFVSFRPRNGLGRLSRPNDVPLLPVGPGAYRSHQIWHQDEMGLGYWFRDVHEILIVGARGKIVAPAPGTQERSVISAPISEHSAKPKQFAEMIERFFPTLPKIELFARNARPGWDVWGYEAPNESDGATATADTQPAPENTSAEASSESEDAGGMQDRRESIPPPQSRSESNERQSRANGRIPGADGVASRLADGRTSDSSSSEIDEPAGAGASASAPDRQATIEKLRAAISTPTSVSAEPDMPDELTRVELSKKDIAMLNRVSLEDCDASEQVFIKLLRADPALATVANLNRLKALAEAQGLTTEQVL